MLKSLYNGLKLKVSRFKFNHFSNELDSIGKKNITSRNNSRKILCLYFDGMPANRMETYGGPIPTPNFTNLASKGTLYEKMIVTAPSTAMCITSMLTGLYPHQFGRRSWNVEDKGALEGKTTLLDELNSEKIPMYFLWDETFMIRRTQNKYKILDWDKLNINFLDIAQKEIQTEQTLKLIKQINKENNSWFSYIRFSDTASSTFKGKAKEYSPYTFDDEIIEADFILGKIMNSISNDVDVIIFSDHGKAYGENGIYKYAFNLRESTLHVPFITSWGGGSKIKDLKSIIDFADIIQKRPLKPHDYIFADTSYADQWTRSTMVRRGKWKYIYNRTQWPFPEELYDLEADPGEMINLVGKYRDPYRDKRPKGDTVSKQYSPSGEVLDGLDVSQIYPRRDWKNIKKVINELRSQREKIWEEQNVNEKNYK